ncbi:hypothetical protein GCM10010123_36630 [Pilimelia anulata]|uniref:Uncharacterized protein n=1 Tax=Pilimelia anulata TaxID=53371 RepID=A0A8J3B966_9ACTN|nr:hypothetical protein [Pilimelia anulata]GGK03361.1 hypothetical protein GCM10010123_36630 [Pilimelia anulata]
MTESAPPGPGGADAPTPAPGRPAGPPAPRPGGASAPGGGAGSGRRPAPGGEPAAEPEHPLAALLAAVTAVDRLRYLPRPIIALATTGRSSSPARATATASAPGAAPPTGPSADPADLVGAVGALLDAAAPRIPHAVVDAAAHPDVRGLLDAAVAQLERPGSGWRPLPFPRYRDVAAIADLHLTTSGVDRRAAAIRAAIGPPNTGAPRATEPMVSMLTAAGTVAALSAGQAGGTRLSAALYALGVALLCVVLALAARRLWTVAGPRWRLRRLGRRGVGVERGAGVLAEATTWTADAVASARDPGAARLRRDRVLVAAFLADLRAAHRRRWWSGDWRTAYPVLVLADRAGAPAAATLLAGHAATADARALVVVTDRPDPRARYRPLAQWTAYRRPWAGGADRTRPWALVLDAAALAALAAATAGPAARPARRTERARSRLLAAALGASLLAGAGVVAYRSLVWACRPGVFGENVVTEQGQEIGYRLCGAPFGGPASRSARYEKLIYAENRRVERLRREQPARRPLTLVLLTALTRPSGDARTSQVAESEDLAGAYAVQLAVNNDGPSGGPLLRLAVANAGAASGHAGLAVDRLGELLAADPTVRGGVVTLDSREAVKQALTRLDPARFVMISPTMTAEDLVRALPGFFQMIAPNGAQAELVRRYVDRVAPGATLIDVYAAGAEQAADTYVLTLRRELARRFGKRFGVWRWSRPGEPPGRDRDGPLTNAFCGGANRVLFFGGRYTDFRDFTWDLVDTCNGRIPLLIADDSTSRFIADRDLAASAPPGLAVVMATKSVLLSCRRLLDDRFAGATAGPAGTGVAPRLQFRRDIGAALQRCPTAERAGERADELTDLAGGWAATSYEAVRLLHWAAGRAEPPRAGAAPAGPLGERMAAVLRGGTQRVPLPYGVNSPVRFDADRVSRSRRTSLVCLRDLTAAAVSGTAADVAVEVARRGTAYPADGREPVPVTCPPPAVPRGAG